MRRILLTAFLLVLAALGAQAQFVGFTSPQTVTSVPFNASTCSAALAAGQVLVPNIGQGAHFLTAVGGASAPTALTYTIQGSFDGSNFFDISDVGTGPITSLDAETVTGVGYFPVIAAKVTTCTPGASTFTLRYSGISLTPGAPTGAALNGQQLKHLAAVAAANTTFSTAALRSPFGTSAGVIEFAYNGSTGPAGSTLQLNCGTTPFIVQPVIFTATLQTFIGAQVFAVPNFSCPYFTVTYFTGGASTATYTLDYAFAPPGTGLVPNQFAHITSATATVVKATAPAVLHSLVVNSANASAATVSIFDLPSASCTGTPATNTVAVITTPASANGLPPYLYDVNFQNGICVKASAAMDVTVSYQ